MSKPNRGDSNFLLPFWDQIKAYSQEKYGVFGFVRSFIEESLLKNQALWPDVLMQLKGEGGSDF